MTSYISAKDLHEFQRNAVTGDILLFSGDNVWSRVIGLFTESDWTHVTFVIRNQYDGLLYVLESVSHGNDMLMNHLNPPGVPFVSGVRVVCALEKISSYKGKMCLWKHWQGPSIDSRDVISLVHGKFRDVPYEKNKIEALRSSFDMIGMSNRHESLGSLFCSELIARVFMDLGYLDPSRKPSNAYTPGDFEDDKYMGWIGEARGHPDCNMVVRPRKGIVSTIPIFGVCLGLFVMDEND